jgi:NADPH:quinone reductase
MRAAFYKEHGAARDVLLVGDLPSPEPGPGEVRIQIKASGVNPSDVKSRAGSRRAAGFDLTIPHSDGAGIIESVGADVDPSRIGQRVWIWNGQWRRPFGTAAELITLPEAQAVPLPEHISFEIGACIGIPLLTAIRAVHWKPISVRGETMLIAGGAGAVGNYAVQLAKRAGYRVISTVSSTAKAEIVSAAGADAVVNYRTDDVHDAVLAFTDGRGLDRIVEVNLSANAAQYEAILRHDGHVVVYGSDDWTATLPLISWLVHGIEVAFFIVYELPPEVRKDAIERVQSLLLDPSFQHKVAHGFPLEQIVQAHEAVESGTAIGNVVLTLD